MALYTAGNNRQTTNASRYWLVIEALSFRLCWSHCVTTAIVLEVLQAVIQLVAPFVRLKVPNMGQSSIIHVGGIAIGHIWLVLCKQCIRSNCEDDKASYQKRIPQDTLHSSGQSKSAVHPIHFMSNTPIENVYLPAKISVHHRCRWGKKKKWVKHFLHCFN